MIGWYFSPQRLIALLNRTSRGGGLALLLALCLSSWAITAAVQEAAAQDNGNQPATDPAATPNGEQPQGDNPDAEEEKEEELPTLEEMQPLSVARLMKGPAEDWVVLKHKDQVIVVQPVEPRPNTLEVIADRLKTPDKYEPKEIQFDAEGNRLRGEELQKARRVWRKTLIFLEIYLPFDEENIDEDADRKFLLDHRKIKEVIHFEDMMLKQIDKFLDNKQISEAYEMVVALRKRAPQWPGLQFREDRLMFAEAERQVDEGRYEFALVNLELLYQRDPEFPGLSDAAGRITDKLVGDAYGERDYRRTRHFIDRLRAMFPDHNIVTQWSDRLIGETKELMDQAQAAEANGQIEQGLDLAEQAARIWPLTPGLKSVYDRLANRHQRLRVAVLELPRETPGPIIRTAADERRRELTQSRLFEPDRLDDRIVRYRSRYFTEWEPTNLGRRIEFQLRPRRQAWESQQVVIATPLIRQLGDRLTAGSETYDERLSDFVESVSLKSPYVFDIDFANVPFRPEPLLAYPLDVPGPFQLAEQNENLVRYRRTVPEPPDEKQLHVAEIIEVKYPSYEKAVQGLLRGEIDMLPQLPPRDVPILSEHSAFFVQKYQLPTTYVVQFNPRKKPLRSRALRRAMASAINYEDILEKHLLEAPAEGKARMTSAPYPRVSYAYDKNVPPPAYDIELALALAIAARKELDGPPPTLKMRYTPGETNRAVAEQLIAAWARIGLQVELIEEGPDADDWDLAYREVRMHEPVVELWPLLTGASTAEIADLEYLPNWLRQKLMQLDRVSDWSRAETLLRELHRDLAAEMQIIPLWEVDEYRVVRKTLRDLPDPPISTYDGIERWVVQPWFPKK